MEEEINNENDYEKNCKKEYLKLKREIKISKLLLNQKKQELNEEFEKNEKLKIKYIELFDKIKEISEKSKIYELQNKDMEYDINLKEYEKQKLFKEITEGKLVPLNNEVENKDDFNYDNYDIFQRDI